MANAHPSTSSGRAGRVGTSSGLANLALKTAIYRLEPPKEKGESETRPYDS